MRLKDKIKLALVTTATGFLTYFGFKGNDELKVETRSSDTPAMGLPMDLGDYTASESDKGTEVFGIKLTKDKEDVSEEVDDVTEVNEPVEVVEEQVEEEKPKKRGRKSKAEKEAEEAAKQAEEVVEEAPKKRGRKKKVEE